jgi:polysaccharide biosynthesis/export protein
MTFPGLHIRIAGFLCLLPLASCSLVSETGPLKGEINEGSTEFQLVEVTSRAQVPKYGRLYGKSEMPPKVKGDGYSENIRERDIIQIIITDLNEQSPFQTKGEPFRFGPVEVPEDGKVTIPYVGEIEVLDKTLSAISSDLSEKIKPVSNTARVAVARSERFPRIANVIGEVKKPGPIPLERKGVTSTDLLAATGGPTSAEHLYNYTLRRGGRDYKFDYLGFRQKPFPIEEGDLLSVTTDTSNRFHVMGAINRPTTVQFPSPEPVLADALGAATGFDERRSDPSGVFVFRKGTPDIVFTFNLKNPETMALIQRFPIEGEDIVYVTEAPLARWNRLISQILPTSISQALNSAGRYSN